MSHYFSGKKSIISTHKPLICYPLISVMTSILTFVVKGGPLERAVSLVLQSFRRFNSALVVKIPCTILQTSTPKPVQLNFTIRAVFPFRGPPTARALRWRKARPWLKTQINQSHASVVCGAMTAILLWVVSYNPSYFLWFDASYGTREYCSKHCLFKS